MLKPAETTKIISQVVDKISWDFRPEKIVLFGLYAKRLTQESVQRAVCDQGCRGHGVTTSSVSIVPRRENHASWAIRRWWRRRNAIEPIIEHQKSDHRLNRNQLAGEFGDQINAIFLACGFNIKKPS